MAITRSQQAKQLLAQGGRTGFALGGGGGADYDIGGGGNPNRTSTTSSTNREKGIMSRGKGPKGTTKSIDKFVETGPDRSAVDTGSKYKKNVNLIKKFERTRPDVKTPRLGVLSFLKKPLQKFSDFTTARNRKFFQDVIRAGKIPGLNYKDLSNLTSDELEDAYQDYMSNRLAGKTDAYGNPMAGFSYDSQGNLVGSFRDDGPDPIPFIPPVEDDTKEDTVTPVRNLGGATARIGGSLYDFDTFAAEGGRIGLQEGGGIEQRLEKLGGDVTSAEQLLQGINKRLETAESSLGSGGGGLGNLPMPANFQPVRPGPFMGRPILQPLLDQPLGQPLPATLEAAQPGTNPFGIINSLTDPRGPAFDTMENAYKNAVDSSAEMKRIGRLDQLDVLGGRLSFEDYKKNFSMDDKGFVTRNPGSTPLGMQSQGTSGVPALGFADGGIASLDREAFLLGGLAKGLKKAVRGVKKLAKSPIGKVALLAAGAGYGGFGPLKGLFSGVKGAGFLKSMAVNKSLLGTSDFMGGPTGILDLIKANPMKSIFAASALAGLTAKPEEGEDDYMKNYYSMRLEPTQSVRGMGSEFDFYGNQFVADGGRIGYDEGGKDLSTDPNYKGWKKLYEKNPDAAAINENHEQYLNFYERDKTKQAEGSKEPVAKKTLPLLDMGGKEKDYRETGGFVDMGRMEKADDVPARLSKNEFVFTADAVRNAGDGDIDKGAEVMYNMMKNLEAGGEVSEESQGLEGARKMFQTSQRLGEVL